MLPNDPLRQLYTEARHLTTQLDGLARDTPEYEVVAHQLQANQTIIYTTTEALRALGTNLSSKH